MNATRRGFLGLLASAAAVPVAAMAVEKMTATGAVAVTVEGRDNTFIGYRSGTMNTALGYNAIRSYSDRRVMSAPELLRA